MSEEKTNHIKLEDEQVEEAAGGWTVADPRQITFKYGLGYKTEICDHEGIFHNFTHTGTVTKRGYTWKHLDYNGEDVIVHCYFFEGDSDIRGWYTELMIDRISTHNYADDDRLNPSTVTVVD